MSEELKETVIDMEWQNEAAKATQAKDVVEAMPDIYPGIQRVKKEDILDKPIIIYEYKVLTSTTYNPAGADFAIMRIKVEGLPGERSVGGSNIFVKQLKRIAKFPVITKIIKPEGKRYFCLYLGE